MSDHKKKSHGGPRKGAGRPVGSGRFKEPSKAIRVPLGSVDYISSFLENDYPTLKTAQTANDVGLINIASRKTDHPTVGVVPKSSQALANKIAIPLFSSSVAAGYPSPAEDHISETLDLNDYMVRRPDTTFMLRVEGESMKDVGILPNDILVVDRSIQATHNKIVIAAIDGELTVKRLFNRGGLIKLLPENSAFSEIVLESESDLHIWGVVIGSFRRFQSF